jgi:hypothetical protein
MKYMLFRTNRSQVLIILIWFVPESPLYHARKGQNEKAKSCMLKLYGTARDYDVVSCPHERDPE